MLLALAFALLGGCGGTQSVTMELDAYLQEWYKSHRRGETPKVMELEGQLSSLAQQHRDQLIDCMSTNQFEEQIVAAIALGFTHDPVVIPTLLDALRSRIAHVRANAAMGLALHGDPSIPMEPLIATLQDYNDDVRNNATYAISQLVRPGKDRGTTGVLLRALKDENWKVRNQAVRALGTIGDTEVAPILVRETLDDNLPHVRQNTILALAAMKARGAVPLIIEKLRDPEYLVREIAYHSLRELTGEKVRPPYKYWLEWWNENKDLYPKLPERSLYDPPMRVTAEDTAAPPSPAEALPESPPDQEPPAAPEDSGPAGESGSSR